jgi:hypothetical protein
LAKFAEFTKELRPTGRMRARAKQPAVPSGDACRLPPENMFRGPENQLYRIEVHTGGLAWPGPTSGAAAAGGAGSGGTGAATDGDFPTLPGATFKWSRENGAVTFPVESLNGAVARVTTLGRDGKLGLEVGDRVEIVDEAWAGRVADDILPTASPRPAPRLRQVVAIDEADLLVTLDQQAGDEACKLMQPAFLRRWDHQPVLVPDTGSGTGAGAATSASIPAVAPDGALPLVEGQWLDLEDGVQVWFEPEVTKIGSYRRGDWWYAPARVVTGDVLWPQAADGPAPLAPNGVEYHYAPLAFVLGTTVDSSLLKTFPPLVG